MGWTLDLFHPLSLGAASLTLIGANVAVSTAWPSANLAILYPFRLPKLATVCKLTVGCGATAAGNFDVGIYDQAGNLIVSSGSTGKAAAAEVNCDVTDTAIGPGLYYAALAADGTNNYVAATATSAQLLKILGIRQVSSAFTLPSSVTFETIASAFVPSFSVRFRGY